MSKTILITGGARSGKSQIAEARVLELGARAVYIATAQPHDTEMEARIAAHQARRGAEWSTISEPMEVLRVLQETDGLGPRLLDCLTLWLTNLMLADKNWQAAGRALAAALPAFSSPVVIVTNEVGSGIVPQTALGREFRDAAGALNQWVAEASDEVYLAVSGLPLKVK